MTGACPLCGAPGARPRRGRGGLRLHACPGCGGAHLDPADHPVPPALYDRTYFEPWDMTPRSSSWGLRVETARARLRLLSALGARGRLLDLGCAGGYFVAEALRAGFDAEGLDVSEHAVRVAETVAPGRVRRGTLEEAAYPAASFDAVTAFDVVEHHDDPRSLLARIHGLLRAGGHLAATVPDLSSLTSRLMGRAWPHFKVEHRFYPTREGFRRLLRSAGFAPVHEEAARKRLSVAYLAPLLAAYPVPVLTPLFALAAKALPRSLREASFTITIGERLYVARAES